MWFDKDNTEQPDVWILVYILLMSLTEKLDGTRLPIPWWQAPR